MLHSQMHLIHPGFARPAQCRQRLPLLPSTPVPTVQGWVLRWYSRLLMYRHPLYTALSQDMSALFGGLWVHMAVSTAQHTTLLFTGCLPLGTCKGKSSS